MMLLEQFKDLDPFILSSIMGDFQAIVQQKSFPKHHILHREGTICNHLYIIEKGIARAYYYKDGKDITAHFAVENGSITAIDSFIQRKRSRYNIELLEDSEVHLVAYQDIQLLLEQKPTYEKYIRLFLEQIYVDLAERIEDLLFHTAKERYQQLLQKNPSLIQRVNLGHIASFIGISQETLSRIRTQV
ncbi:Crp/Fnr family transcriptional regulator [Aureispira anguillae]|uniref:Crp/Fnr family transcriptional regulator n=1 Tax=Aureispira anguillae TaxID=2864201 RepID=A0A915YGW7_9BACT|nr:Crp/Fnr family transcriptional regulator [Aureispira anguillae]BDS12947.1 Crp/Fnr family transcriptional regulator [Aureispira anguillae]